MKAGIIFSASLHLFVLAVIFFGLPQLFKKEVTQEHAVVVEILPISDQTNVKKKKVVQKEKPVIKEEALSSLKKPAMKQPVATPKIDPIPLKPEKVEPVKKEKIEVAEIKPVEKQQPKKEAPKKEEKKQDISEDSFGAVLNTVEELKKEQKLDKKEEVDFSDIEDMLAADSDQPEYKPGLPLSISEKDEIKRQIVNNWSVVSGAKDAKDMVVTLNIKIAQNGEVTKIDIAKNMLRYNSDPFYKAMVESAIRAVSRSSPLKGLPPEKYMVKNGWQEIELNFDPSEMMY
jgi:hypothetical protein